MTRKSPYRHPVRSYTREGHRVDRYVRGEGKKPVEPTTLLSNNERNNERALGYRRVAERRIPIPDRRRVQVGWEQPPAKASNWVTVGWEEPPAETKRGAKIYYKPIKFKGVERTKYDAQGNFYKYMERVYRKTGEGITRDEMWVKQIPIYQDALITLPPPKPTDKDMPGPYGPITLPPPKPPYTDEVSPLYHPPYTGEGDVPIIPPSRGIIGTDPKWASYYAQIRKEQAREERRAKYHSSGTTV